MWEFDWQFWAHHIRGLTASEGLVVREIAFLADWRGVALASNNFLARSTGLSSRSVARAKKGLETKAVLSVAPRWRADGGQGISRYELNIKAMSFSSSETTSTVSASLMGKSALPVPARSNRLGQLVYKADSDGWCGDSSDLLANYLKENIKHLSKSVRQNLILGMSLEQARDDALGWAWQVARLKTRQVLGANDSWAMLSVLVARMSFKANASRDLPLEAELMEGKDVVSGSDQVERLPGADLDDLENVYGPLISDLVLCGVDESLAWAYVLRVVDIAVCSYDVSRRHTLAATDAKLSALGLAPKAARKLMTLVSGTRGESKPFFELDKPHYERLLCDVIEGINFV